MANIYQASDIFIDINHTIGDPPVPLPEIVSGRYTLYTALTPQTVICTVSLNNGLTYNSITGTVTVHLTEEDTALAVGSLKHDCVVRLTTGEDIFILSEKIKFLPTISRIA